MEYRELIQAIVLGTLAGALIFTVVATCLSLLGWVKFADPRQQRHLFRVLIVQLAGGSVAAFLKLIPVDPRLLVHQIEARATYKATSAKDTTPIETDSVPHPTGNEADARVATVAHWGKANQASMALWSTLLTLDQIGVSFAASGSLRMKDLKYWVGVDTQDMRSAKAQDLASNVDNVIRNIRLFKRIGNHAAQDEMARVLLNPNATLSDLAQTLESVYDFSNRGSAS